MEMKSRAELPEKALPVDFWPHPLTTHGRCVIVAEPGKTLLEVLEPHISVDQPAVATINGELVVKERWADVVLRDGDVVQVRLTVADGGGGSNPIAVVLSLAVLVAAPYLAGFALTGQFGGFGLIAAAETALGQVLTAAIGIGGILIVNSLFPPRLPGTGATEEPTPQYSISGGANRARPYEPLQLLLGQHRLFPDLASREYTEYDAEGDQFLNQIFDFGLGENLDITNIRIGETLLIAAPPQPRHVPLTTDQDSPPLQITSPNFEGVQMQVGVATVDLVSGNVDTISGGDFETQLPDGMTNGTPYITRTTDDDTTAIAFDLVSQHFEAGDDGALSGRATKFELGWKQTSESVWQTENPDVVTPDGAEARNATRRSVKIEGLTAAAYDVRVRLREVYDDTDDLSRITFRASVPQMRAYQDSAADFTGRNPLALRIKASGQLYGRVETLNADGAQLIPAWNGSAYVARQRTSNPADLLLWWLRGLPDRRSLGRGLRA